MLFHYFFTNKNQVVALIVSLVQYISLITVTFTHERSVSKIALWMFITGPEALCINSELGRCIARSGPGLVQLRAWLKPQVATWVTRSGF